MLGSQQVHPERCVLGQVSDPIRTEFYTQGYCFQKSLSLNHLGNSRRPAGVLFPQKEAKPWLTVQNGSRQGGNAPLVSGSEFGGRNTGEVDRCHLKEEILPLSPKRMAD